MTKVASELIVPTSSVTPCSRRTVRIGIFTRSLRLTASRKIGVSAIVRRTYKPTSTSAALARNGMRQPKA